MLATQGVDYIQLDAPRYSYFIDPSGANGSRRRVGQDPEAGAR